MPKSVKGSVFEGDGENLKPVYVTKWRRDSKTIKTREDRGKKY